VETDYSSDFSWEKTIEKTILNVLASDEFSHSLDPISDIGEAFHITHFSSRMPI
jgi:hypothetical protein